MSETIELHGRQGLEKICDLIKDIRTCMLTTVAPDGALDSRPMETLKMDPEGTFWFLMHGGSGVMAEVERDSHISLIYAEPKDSTYVIVKGRGTTSNDKAMIHELWNPMYNAWFAKGESDSSIVLLRVEVSDAQYWTASSSKLVVHARYLAAALTSGKVAVSETGKLSL